MVVFDCMCITLIILECFNSSLKWSVNLFSRFYYVSVCIVVNKVHRKVNNIHLLLFCYCLYES